ncbi:hypothetical protein ACVIHH_008230 [Bradyrhizobium sp. USDA 4518]
MNYLNAFVVPALAGSERSQDVERYLALFEDGISKEVPPFFQAGYGTSFRYHVENPYWVIQSLISNAIKEGEGSRDLASVADSCESQDLMSDLAIHIGDEARHCRMYLQLIDTVFPVALTDDLRQTLFQKFPSVTYDKTSLNVPLQPPWKMLDYLIQINLGEVRTRIHQKLLEPVLHAYCPEENKESLCRTLCKLAGDECCHIKYTASRIGALSREFSEVAVRDLFLRRFCEFNRYTDKELGRQRDGIFSTAPLLRDR